jgi:2-polyprenyl-3-methyl-5-hydroxy-6-metoxy-1,4-benzoquinol methylase
MMDTHIHYNKCPICGSSSIGYIFTLKDYAVSGKDFSIWQCKNCSARFTQDIPSAESISNYYQSKEYISHSNTSKGLINLLYQTVRKRTLKQKRKFICKAIGIKQGKLLDVGSGTGAFVNEMQQNGWKVEGLEPDAGARQVALNTFNCRLKTTDELFHLNPNSFDAITLWHVLEHVHDLHKYVDQLKILLKQTGKLIIAVPNYTSSDASFYKKYWAAYDVPRHLYHFSPSSIQYLVEKNGMRLEDIKPMWFDSFYVSLLSSKYKSGKTKWLNAIWIGLKSNLKAMRNKQKCSSVIYIIAKDHLLN